MVLVTLSSTAVERAIAQCASRWAMARGHRLNTSIVLAAVHGLSGLFRAVSAVEPFTLSPPSHSVPVPNRPTRLCGRKATLNQRWGVRLVSGRTSVRYRFGCPLSSERLWFVDTVLWLCPSLPTETLKWLSSLPILMQEPFWWWQCSDRYIISLFPYLHTLFPPFSPSLISPMVSVDVKHHFYRRCFPRPFISLMVSVDVKHHVYGRCSMWAGLAKR